MKRLLLTAILSCNALLSGCAIYDVQAHGDYDAEVRMTWGVDNYYFDPYYGVYVSFGFPSSYWIDGYYYHFSGSHWMRAHRWNGPWLTVAPKFVPRSVHGYRGHLERYPERYPRVKLHPKVSYHHYRDRREGRADHTHTRYRREYGTTEQHGRREPGHYANPSPNHRVDQRPYEHQAHHEQSTHDEVRAPRKIRLNEHPSVDDKRRHESRKEQSSDSTQGRDARAHQMHRQEQRNSPRPKKIGQAQDGQQRSKD